MEGTAGHLSNSINFNTTQQQTEDELWRDFHRHFSNPNRRNTPQNHHDFLDIIRNQKEGLQIPFTASDYGRDETQIDDLLNHDRMTRAHRNYSKMRLAAIAMPTQY